MPPWPGTVEIAGHRVGRLGLSLAGLRTTGMWGEPRDRAAAVATVRRAAELGLALVEVPAPFGPWADLLREADPPDPVVAVRLTGTDPGRDLAVTRRRLGQRLAGRVALVLVPPGQLGAARSALEQAEEPAAAVGAWITDDGRTAARWPPEPPGAPEPPGPEAPEDGTADEDTTAAARWPPGAPEAPEDGTADDDTTGAGRLPPGPLAAVRGLGAAPADLVRECERRGIAYIGADPGVLVAGQRTVLLLEPDGPAELERLYRRAVTPPAAGPG